MTIDGKATRLANNDIGSPVDDNPLGLIAALWNYKRAILLTSLAFVLVAIVYLHTAEYRYTAEMRVVASQTAANSSAIGGAASRLGNLASLVGISTSSESASPFRLYLEALTSREVAVALAKRPDLMHVVFSSEWDSATQSWRPRRSPPAIETLKSLLGFPHVDKPAPDAARLQDYLARNIKVNNDVKRTVTVIRFDHADPKFAITMLSTINAAADARMKAVALQRASAFAKYLEARLPTILVAEHRVAIADVLSEQEKQIMLASSSAPYAADPVEAPTASLAPTSPRPMVVLIASALFGMVFGTLGAMAAIAVAKARQPTTA